MSLPNRTGGFAETGVDRSSDAGQRPRGRFGRELVFSALAPAIVALLGVATAVAIATLGMHELRSQSDETIALQSRLLSLTLAARVRATPEGDRAMVLERAARRSGAQLLLVEQDGKLVVDDGSLAPPPQDEVVKLLVAGEGEATTALGRTRFSATTLAEPLEHLSLLAFVRAPETPFASASLLTSVAALTAILLGAAALVAFAFARDIQSDVTFVRERIVEMASETGEPAGKAVPVRSVDQVGLLTSAFNVLVDRFAAAESAYRADLEGALAYDHERSAFLAALSHELRTPLNAILGFTDVLLSEVDGPLSPEAAENLAVVRTSGEHLRSLIDDILDLSALESGELRLSRQRCDVYRIAEDVVREAQAAAANKRLEIRLKGRSAVARVDPRRVRQILTNLVGNAIKFTARGRVVVEVDGKEEYVSLMVTDTGPGIAREEQEAIFEEYRQSGELSVQRAGTGLGLAIVRRLVAMHSGSIGVESKLGVGSSFAILLPREPPDLGDEPPRSSPSHTSHVRLEAPR